MSRIPLYTEDRLLFLERRSRWLRWLALALVVAWSIFFAVAYDAWS